VDEQRDLGHLLRDKSTRLVSVIGRAGIGKTALASKVLADLEQNRPPAVAAALQIDGIVYLSTRTTGITLDRLFAECADLLDETERELLLKAWASPQVSLTDKIERLLKTLDGGSYVILLDHLEDLLDADGHVTDEGLRAFLDQSLAAPRGARLLVTSRTPVHFDDSRRRFDKQVPLKDGLATADGVSMLRELDPNGLFGLRDLPSEQLARAVDRLHGVPRALEVLAGIKRDKRFRSLDTILDAFYQETLVDELIREGYRRLDPGERRIIDALAVMGRPVPPVAVEFMVALSCPGMSVEAMLVRLIDIYMVTFHATQELFSLDAIDQDYALSQLSASDRQALDERAADYYSRLQIPKESWQSLSDVEPYMLAVEHLCAAQQWERAAETLGRVNPNFVAVRGNPQALADLYERLQGKIADTHLQAVNLAGLGVVRTFLGPLDVAYSCLERAAELARQTGDRELAWRASTQLGEVCRRLGRLDEAVTILREAVDIGKAMPSPTYSDALILSLILSYRGDFREAIACSESVLPHALQAQDVELEAHVHDGLSLAYLGLGAYDQAYDHARQAIVCYAKAGPRDPVGYVFNVQGMASIGRGQFDEARTCFETGRSYGETDCNPRLAGFNLFNLGRLERLTNAADAALRAAGAAHDVLSRIGAPEAAAAAALCDAIRAAQAGDRSREAESLLACARASMPSADLYPPLDLFSEVEALARAADLTALASEAVACRAVLEERRKAEKATAG
jgi:tetratricopeptide (TPR) repeat protein